MSVSINFYHLTQTPPEKALPRLLEKAFESGKNTLVRLKDQAQCDHFNKQLWTYTTTYFLPHGAKEDGHYERQPIYLTPLANNNPNQAKILSVLAGAAIDDIASYEKALYMFDGTDEAQLQQAKADWRQLTSDGLTPVYWQQNDKGAWEQGK